MEGGGPPKIVAPPARGILKFISPARGHLVFQFSGRAGGEGTSASEDPRPQGVNSVTSLTGIGNLHLLLLEYAHWHQMIQI